MIPMMRIRNVATTAASNSLEVDVGGGWLAAAVSANTWEDALQLNDDDAIPVASTCVEEALTAASAVGFSCVYNYTGTNRGKFTWNAAAGTFIVQAVAGDDLMNMMGFTNPSAVPAASQTATRPCGYAYIPKYNLKDSEGFAWARGASWEYIEATAAQTVSQGGKVYTEASTGTYMVRPITFTCCADADMDWLRDFWEIARDGRLIYFYQDYTITTAYNRDTNPWGYFTCVLDVESCKKFKYDKTYRSTPNLFDVTFILRKYVS